MFSFSNKLFNLVIKDIDAMDASILKGSNVSETSRKKVSADDFAIFLSIIVTMTIKTISLNIPCVFGVPGIAVALNRTFDR